MPRSAPVISLPRLAGADALPECWRRPLLCLAIAWLGLFAGFLHDWQAIGNQAWNSSTYNHIALMPFILGWMVWRRAPELARIEPEAWWPGLILTGGASLVWLLGAVSGLDVARQLGAVAVLISTVPVLLGVRVTAGLVFPLSYALLMVPIGEELVPALQMITAAITVWLVEASGIPALIDGVFIETPAGLFEVAEACSGVKFLIAMIALGILVANLCFVSLWRRLQFFLACLVVPILANGVRAWATIYAAQIVGVDAALGFDHIVYGWFFFALVIFLVLAAAWRFFDRPVDDPMIDAAVINASPLLGRLASMRIGVVPALAVFGLLVFGSQAWARASGNVNADLPAQVFLPDVPGWKRVDYQPRFPWEPLAQGAEHRLLGRYRDGQGRMVDVFVAIYSGQGEGREAGGFGQGALTPGSGWSWQSPGPAIGNGKSEELLATDSTQRTALTWYRTGGLLTGSNARLKLATMRDRFLLSGKPTITLILSAEDHERYPPDAALRSFVDAAGPLDQWMDRLAGLR